MTLYTGIMGILGADISKQIISFHYNFVIYLIGNDSELLSIIYGVLWGFMTWHNPYFKVQHCTISFLTFTIKPASIERKIEETCSFYQIMWILLEEKSGRK